MRPRFGGLAFALALLLAACSGAEDPAGESSPADVLAATGGAGLTVTNTSHTEIVYGARDARVQFIQPQCWAPDVCPRLAPGASAEVPFDEIVGYEASTTEVIVESWEYIVDPEHGPRLGNSTQTRVKL